MEKLNSYSTLKYVNVFMSVANSNFEGIFSTYVSARYFDTVESGKVIVGHSVIFLRKKN